MPVELNDLSCLVVSREVNARGLKCPLPILYAKKALNSLDGGEVLKLLATDPNTAQDFTLFCQQTGHELLAVETLDPSDYPHDFVIWLRKMKK